MLLGEFQHGVDQKNRIFVPAKLREELGESFIIACSVRDKCLKVYSQEGWEEYLAPIKKQEKRISEPILRAILHNAVQVSPDTQGRILLPAAQLQYAEITKDVVIVGCSDYAEIWAAENYAVWEENLNLEDIRQKMEGFGL